MDDCWRGTGWESDVFDGRRGWGGRRFGDVAGDVGLAGDDVGVGGAEVEALLDAVAAWMMMMLVGVVDVEFESERG